MQPHLYQMGWRTAFKFHGLRDNLLYEARKKRGKTLYRLFCLLDRQAPMFGLPKPTLVVISGGQKPLETEMEDWIYKDAQAYRDEYRSPVRTKRPVQLPLGIPKKFGN